MVRSERNLLAIGTMADFRFELIAGGASGPRLGRVHTAHGAFDTPAFLPVGTQGTVKTVTPEEVRETGAQAILANTYHLHLRPGERLVRELGGLHRFMDWDGPILTDSGGFQVFSLSELRTLTPEGVALPLAPRRLEPLPLARDRGADPGGPRLGHHDGARRVPAVPGHLRAGRRVARADAGLGRALQGGLARAQRALRHRAGRRLPGAAAARRRRGCARSASPATRSAGFSVGEPPALMYELVGATAPHLPADKPRYLMGVGTPADLVEAVDRGIDFFDCVMPTRNARNGSLFTAAGTLNIRNAAHAADPGPVEPGCPCAACRSLQPRLPAPPGPLPRDASVCG